MSSHNKQGRKQCNKHAFQLKPKQHTCFYQQTINANFCDKSKVRSKSQKNKAVSCFEGPIFNKDNNYLTSSFIMSSQKKKYNQNGPIVENQNKYYNFHDQKSQMLVPKPNSKNMYCNVCKEKYEDYLQHVELIKHKKKIQNNIFNDYIGELETKYKANRSVFKLKQKQITLLTEASNVIVIDESSNQIEQMAKPRKRVKRQTIMQQKQVAPEPLRTLEQRYKNNYNEYNSYYEQATNRLRNWNLFQLNSLRMLGMNYPGYYPGLNGPICMDPNFMFSCYNGVQNPSINMNLYNPYLVPYGMCNVNPAAGIGIPKNVIDIEHDPYQEQFQIANKV